MKTVASDTAAGARTLASNLLNDPLGTVASGASNVWGKAIGAAAWTGEVASNLTTDPAATIGRGVDNTLSTGAAIWHGIADPYAEAYAKGGIAQALGRGTFDVVKLGAEALITKGALSAAGKAGTVLAETAKVADKAEDAADAAKKAEEVAQKAEKLEGETESGSVGARITRVVKSLRDKYLGRTPGKNSKTGKAVRERMREEGTLRTNRRGQDEFLDESGTWRLVDTPQTHMGHYPVDAVDYWNETGRYYGAKAPEVRAWMLDSNNYRFEWGPLNSARGGATTSRYLPPVK